MFAETLGEFRYERCYPNAAWRLSVIYHRTGSQRLPSDVAKSSIDDTCHCAPVKSKRYTRIVAEYRVPDLELIDVNGERQRLRKMLDHDGPVMIQFAFTSCSTICPVLSATFAGLQKRLSKSELKNVRMLTISIDPKHDSPERLGAYAKQLKAGKQWSFLTGSESDIASVRKAFDAFTANKMRHEPLIFLRADSHSKWVRLNGLLSVELLLKEYRAMQSDIPTKQVAKNDEPCLALD